MPEGSIITDEVRAAIGLERTGPGELVEARAIKDFAVAINWPDPPDPLHVDSEYARRTRFGGIIAPWTFYTSLGHTVTLPALPLPRPHVRMNAGNDYRSLRPIRPGDVITTTSKIAEVVEREGRAGKLVFTVTQNTYTNQNGEVVGILRKSFVSQY